MADIKLKLCPFCGGNAEVELETDSAKVQCSKCGVSTEYYEDFHRQFSRGGMGNLNDYHVSREASLGIDKAIEAWNRRYYE